MVVHLEQTQTFQIIVTTGGDTKPIIKIVPVNDPTHERTPDTRVPTDAHSIDEPMNAEDLREL